MARRRKGTRRRYYGRRARAHAPSAMTGYSAANQLDTTTWIIIGGVGLLALVGVGIYLYIKNQSSTSTTAANTSAANAGLTQAQVSAQFPQAVGLTPDQTAAFLSGDVNAQGVPTG